MRIGAESEIWLEQPVFQIVPRLPAGARKIRNLVARNAHFHQTPGGDLVKVGGQFIGVGGSFFAGWITPTGAMPARARQITVATLVAGMAAALLSPAAVQDDSAHHLSHDSGEKQEPNL